MFVNPWFFILCMVTDDPRLFVFFVVVHESLVCSEQLNWSLFFRKILHVLQILQFYSIFWVFEPFPAVTEWFWDSSFHLRDSNTIIKKVQTFTDAPEGNTMH